MRESERLLRAILERPDDDALRLVYADCLEDENSGSLARFIREQMLPGADQVVYEIRGNAPRAERAISGGHTYDEAWLKRFLANYLHTFPSIGGTLTFRRGMVESVRCPLQAWLAHGEAIVARQPVTKVEVMDKEPDRWHISDKERFGWLHNGYKLCDRPDVIVWCLQRQFGMNHQVGGWPSREEAVAALSLACVNHARAANGLPPLS